MFLIDCTRYLGLVVTPVKLYENQSCCQQTTGENGVGTEWLPVEWLTLRPLVRKDFVS